MRRPYVPYHQIEMAEKQVGRLIRAAGLSEDRAGMANRLIGLGDFPSAEAIRSASPIMAISDFSEFRDSTEIIFSRLQTEGVFDAALPDMIAAELRANILTGDAIALFEVGEGMPIPLSMTDIAVLGELLPLKVAALVPFTTEFLRGLKPETDATLIRSFVNSISATTDMVLISRLIQNAGTAIVATSDFAGDILAASQLILGGKAGRLHLVISPTTALQFGFATATDGTFLFPGFDLNLGGNIGGIPTHVSDQLPQDSSGPSALLFDASRIAANKGSIDIQRSENAAIQMMDNPVDGAAQVVSAFQTNSVFIRLLRVFGLKLPSETIAVVFSGVGAWFS
jgi:hypothetical protein